MTIEERLSELGLSLPEVPAPVAAYVPAGSCRKLGLCIGADTF